MEHILNCPFCKGKIHLKADTRLFEYKGGSYNVLAYFYKCLLCQEQFTTTKSDTKTLNQVYDLYNAEQYFLSQQ